MNRPDAAGFFGKLPARGDFVQAGLPADTVAALDLWSAAGLLTARETCGAAFERVWEAAPHWFFALPPGVLHATEAASGIWMPSADRADRCFPLVLVLLHGAHDDGTEALDALLPAMLDAIREGHEPAELERRIATTLARLPPVAAPASPPGDWWRQAAHDRSLVTLPGGALPAGDAFVALLRRAPDEIALLAP